MESKIIFIIIVHAAGFFIRLIKVNILVFSRSCGVDMGDLYVVIGGWDIEKNGRYGYKKCPGCKGSRKVGLYRDDGFVRNLPDLIMGRFYHACAGFQDINGDMVSMILFCCYS